MNKKQELQLQYAAAILTRADQEKNLQGMVRAHKTIKKAVAGIYREKIDVPAVLGVERILNDGLANVLGKASNAYRQMEMLAEQPETGLMTYEFFNKTPRQYVKIAYITRAGVKKGKPFYNGIPYDSVRSALTEYREQLTQELTQRKGDPFPDSTETEKMRFHATVTAERDYLAKFMGHHDGETAEEKQEHLTDFDSKMARLARQVEPPKQEDRQEK